MFAPYSAPSLLEVLMNFGCNFEILQWKNMREMDGYFSCWPPAKYQHSLILIHQYMDIVIL